MAPAEPGAEIAVELAWSPGPGRVERLALWLPAGCTAAQALARGRAAAPGRLPEAPAAVGVWGRACAPDTVLQDGDRLELYRPLSVDPKEARRRRQQAQGPRPRRR